MGAKLKETRTAAVWRLTFAPFALTRLHIIGFEDAPSIRWEHAMARESRYEIENYLLHDIRVRAHRESAGAMWSVRVDVRRPNGEHCRRIEDGAQWSQAEQALLDGFRIGRALVSNGEC